jgi:cobalt-zinc-cadmium efflux system outer membrane protein
LTVRAALCAVALVGCSAAEEWTRAPYAPTQDEHAALAADDAEVQADAKAATRADAEALLAGPEVTLDHVLQAVDIVSPAIAAAKDDALAASGRAWQAGLHPNPSIELEREGPADDRPWGRSQLLLGVRQPIVVSDRRRLAVNAELAGRDARRLSVENVRREVRGAARAAFVDVVYLRESVALHRDLLVVAQQLLDLAKSRLDAQVAVASEALKPELEVYTLRSSLAGFERRRDAARDALSALLGGLPVPVERLTHPHPDAQPDLPALVAGAMESHPALLVARQEATAAQERLALARSVNRPDVNVRVAFGRDFDENDFVAELGVEVPIAAFDAGQGAVFEARALASKARRDVEILERELATELTRRHGAAAAARAELAELRGRILPLAEKTLATTREAYQAGTQQFLDVLDAQRTLLEARATALALERDAALADAEILTLSGATP